MKFSLMRKFSPMNRGGLYWTQHFYINESIARVTPRNTVIAGNVLMCGAGQTYTTITAALAAASSGDIIQLVDGTYNSGDEAGTYLFINQAAKTLLIRGNANDRTAVKIQHSGASGFTIRLYASTELRFENITFESADNVSCFYNDADNANRIFKWKNCVFNLTNNGGESNFALQGSNSAYHANNWYEFENCTFNKLLAGTVGVFVFNNEAASATLLMQSCTFNIANAIGLKITDSNRMKVAIYDSIGIQSSDHILWQFMNDGDTPADTLGLVDLRYNHLSHSGVFQQHNLLLGRGMNECYVVNNTITVPAGNSGLNIGIVNKIISTDVTKTIIAGNIVTASRPMLSKGGQKCTYRWNTFISNDTDNINAGFVTDNFDDSGTILESKDHIITDNNIFGKGVALNCSTEAIVPLAKTSFQSCVVDRNNYYSDNGDWAFDGAVHQLATRDTFWTGAPNNDDNSKMRTKTNYTISPIKKDI
jgi:hypothetical protein